MPVIFEDTFTEAVNTDLSAHTPSPTGTSWTLLVQDTTLVLRVLAASDTVAASSTDTTGGLAYTAQPAASTPEYDVQADIAAVATSSEDSWILLARVVDADNMYGIGIYPNAAAANMKMWKQVANVVTELASGDFDVTAGDTMKFEIRDAAKKLYQNGVERLSTADNALTAAGSGGIAVGRIFVAVDDIRLNIPSFDNFIITEVEAGGGEPAPVTAAPSFRKSLSGLGTRTGARIMQGTPC
ncbi:MAG: hypothetical protein Q7R41_11825 [Phycisphaerales bacterium]|nr:hypothetical protein [Phycisphaerales bacterium]